MRFIAAALLALAAAACVSQSDTQTRPVTDSGGADAKRRAEVHTALAGEYYARGNHSVALAETRLALKDDPTYFPAYNMQGLVYMELREDDQAELARRFLVRQAASRPRWVAWGRVGQWL